MIASEKVRNLVEGYENLNEQERYEFVRLVPPLDESPVSAELNSRADDIDSGRVKLITGEEVFHRLRAI